MRKGDQVANKSQQTQYAKNNRQQPQRSERLSLNIIHIGTQELVNLFLIFGIKLWHSYLKCYF